MCDFSGKLVAWMDHELVDQEAAAIEQHLRECAVCQEQVQRIEQVNGELRAYCDDAMESSATCEDRRWKPIWVGGAVVAAIALAAVFLLVSRRRVDRAPAPSTPAMIAASTPLFRPPAVPAAPRKLGVIKKPQRKRPVALRTAQNQEARWSASQPMIEVAIPADSLLPPGAMPAGVMYIADVTIGADGSVQQVRLEPRLIGFGGRPTP